jgi:polysaccharide biosynthesis protein PslF
LTDPHVADSMATEARGLAPTVAWPVVANAYVGVAQGLLVTQSALT